MPRIFEEPRQSIKTNYIFCSRIGDEKFTRMPRQVKNAFNDQTNPRKSGKSSQIARIRGSNAEIGFSIRRNAKCFYLFSAFPRPLVRFHFNWISALFQLFTSPALKINKWISKHSSRAPLFWRLDFGGNFGGNKSGFGWGIKNQQQHFLSLP